MPRGMRVRYDYFSFSSIRDLNREMDMRPRWRLVSTTNEPGTKYWIAWIRLASWKKEDKEKEKRCLWKEGERDGGFI
jgi:hypothetical protein